METILLGQEDIVRGYLILVNREHKYRKQRQNLSHVGVWDGEGILYERRAAHKLNKLMEDIGGREYIVPVSAWRSLEKQQEIWNQSLEESGLAFTENYVAIPGHSEHQTGLAIDLALKRPEIDFIRPYFPYEGICQTFRRKAAQYGFIQRYQEGKQAITRIGHEPWHFRYVGVPHAEIMEQKGLSLEEYTAFIKGYRYGENPFIFRSPSDRTSYRIAYVKAEGETTRVDAADTQPYSVSGNNCDGFIITEVVGKEDEHEC